MTTMTIKEIAQVAGCRKTTVRNTIKKHLPEVGIRQGVKTVLNSDQALKVMELVKKTNMVSTPDSVKSTPPVPVKSTQNDFQAITEAFCGIVDRMLDKQATMFKEIVSEIRKPDQKTLPAPELSDRDLLSKTIREKAFQYGVDVKSMWNKLYYEALYRTGVNFKLRAKNRQISVIELAERKGYIPQLISIAREVL